MSYVWRVVCSDGVDRVGETFATKQAALTAATWRHYCPMDPHRPVAAESSPTGHAERSGTAPGPAVVPPAVPVPAPPSHSTLPAPSVDAASDGTVERRGVFCSGRRSASDGPGERIGATR